MDPSCRLLKATQSVHKSNIPLFRLLLSNTFINNRLPRLVLGLALEIKGARDVGVLELWVLGCLFEKGVELLMFC